jgi:hypothetical protein
MAGGREEVVAVGSWAGAGAGTGDGVGTRGRADKAAEIKEGAGEATEGK